MSARRFHSTLFPLVLLGACLIAYSHLAFSDWILARGDTYAYFYPYWEARSAAFRAGTLPLWSPDLFMGVPLLANSQIGTFYPPNWLVTPFSAPDAIRISLIGHVIWAGIGAYGLARQALGLGTWGAFAAGLIFALGGVIGAHVEQINQLQGLSWMPFLFWALHRAAFAERLKFSAILLLAALIALQFFTGHTQTVFIAAVGMGIYALMAGKARRRALIALFAAGGLAIILALPQLVPTVELSLLSNRGGGLSQNEATAFSFSPFVAGRGLLPSFDRSIFGEYVAYIGITGLGLMGIGILKRRWAWVALAGIGVFFAFGAYNPVYWLIAGLPGFNLFRVPARWLALFALGAAMLAGIGLDALRRGERPPAVLTIAFTALIGLLAVSTRFTLNNPDGTPAYLPETVTIAGWAVVSAAFVFVLLFGVRRFAPVLVTFFLAALLTGELLLANRALPHMQTVPPEAWSAERFTISQLQVYLEEEMPPGRILSISGGFFDPGDRAALEARYAAWGMNADQIRHALVAIKLKELVAPNLSLAWGIPTIDGFDGGVLPTEWYTQFSALLLPEDAPRTIDGRLRELLAEERCFGACLPDARWLNLTGVRYLILDKVFDLWHEDVAYDTGLPQRLEGDAVAQYTNLQQFVADTVDIAFLPGDPVVIPQLDIGAMLESVDEIGVLAGLPVERVRYRLSEPTALDPVAVIAPEDGGVTVMAVTLVDTRTGDFQQLAPLPWTRVLSSDIKIYQNADTLPRALIVHRWETFPDTYDNTEAILDRMREPEFDPLQMAFLSGELDAGTYQPAAPPLAEIVDYRAGEIRIEVSASAPAVLIVNEAYYPGWTAVDDQGRPLPVVRANGMFMGMAIPDGAYTIHLRYQPGWLLPVLAGGGVVWGAILLRFMVLWRRHK